MIIDSIDFLREGVEGWEFLGGTEGVKDREISGGTEDWDWKFLGDSEKDLGSF